MHLTKTIGCCVAIAAISLPVMATETIIPDSALIPSTSLYTNSIGNIVVMTGGGNAPGVGDPSGRNDDGFSGPINLGFTLDFFGTNYTQFWINNNGNISFGNGIAAYTPSGPTGASQPIISPFFADVDTRGTGSGVVYLTQLANEDIITWNGVGYYNSNDNKLDTFQLVLRGSGYNVPAGQGQIGFFYTTMQWEVGGASGGVNGFCPTGTVGSSCFPAAVGFGNGLGDGEVLQSSLQAGISSVVNDEHIWFDVNGGGIPVPPPTTTPEPSTYALMALGVAGIYVFVRRRNAATAGKHA